MTREEALEYWEQFKKEIPLIYKHSEYKNDMEEQEEATDFAINALEKQIPKKPRMTMINVEYQTAKCPICGVSYYIQDEQPYCSFCGQKLDWGDEE